MGTDIGEFIVGAYLKLIYHCDVIDYNARIPGGGLEGLSELDVIGLRFADRTAYLCEVTTHLRGTLYGTNQGSVEKIRRKCQVQRQYAENRLIEFPNQHFMFWAPYVPEGYITRELATIERLELIINKEYTARIRELEALAKKTTYDANNPFFRTLQILAHLR